MGHRLAGAVQPRKPAWTSRTAAGGDLYGGTGMHYYRHVLKMIKAGTAVKYDPGDPKYAVAAGRLLPARAGDRDAGAVHDRARQPHFHGFQHRLPPDGWSSWRRAATSCRCFQATVTRTCSWAATITWISSRVFFSS